ncbi:cellulase family glycosylhydrolase [Labilibacter marinus]|uniref:cellulase family glycosylhydrolase n=1 Tax=Labilibacter marinus TaxID=1477105 RepID=UPI000950019E|nr:cellulase family glycosylhydrolase [Labilibacter marinus]
MKYIKYLVILLTLTYCVACGDSKEESKPAPVFKSSNPENNASDVSIQTDIEVVFDEVVKLVSDHGITINDEAASVVVSFTKLVFEETLEANTTYTINIPAEAVINTFDVPLEKSIKISFTTKEVYVPSGDGMKFVADMGVGWNLGNTLDTKNADKTYWGNPEASKALIDAVKAKGFKTLRVPITWQYNMGAAPEYTIEQSFLNRVEEVVNYGLDNDMYVIVNIHHDEEWLIPTYAEVDRAKDQLAKVWAQIAQQLKAYDEHLIFETLNETRLKGSAEEWSGGTAEGRDCINQFHDSAITAIRNTGGNNTDRYIMISTYAASTSQAAMDDLVFPSSKNLIAAVHSYFPYKFALAENNYNTEWGTAQEKAQMDAEFDKVVKAFIDKGIPVVMGEWGNLNHNNFSARVEHAGYYANGCISRGICPIWWDNGVTSHFGLINRSNNQWVYPEIAEAILNATNP